MNTRRLEPAICEVAVNPKLGWISAGADWKSPITISIIGRVITSDGSYIAIDGEKKRVLKNGEIAIIGTRLITPRRKIQIFFSRYEYSCGDVGAISAVMNKPIFVRHPDLVPMSTEIWI